MKKIVITLCELVLCVAAVLANDATSLRLGYTDGLEADEGWSLAQTDIEVSAAIYLPAELLAKYSGCELSGTRILLHSKLNIDRMEAWIRTELDSDNILDAMIAGDTDPALAKGWNTVPFEAPYAIPDNPVEGLYVGVTYHQNGSAMGVAYSTKGSPGSSFIQLPGEDWSDVSEEHTFFIEALLTGEALPAVDLRLENVDFPPYYVIDKGMYAGDGVVRNIGTDTVTGFDISLQMEDRDLPLTQHYDCDIEYGDTFAFSYNFRVDIDMAEGDRKATLTVTGVNGDVDTDMSDNSLDVVYQIVPYDMTRRVLLEEFTSERCSNCPRVAGWLHKLLEQPHYREIVVPVCHHSGFGTDFLTIPSDVEYEWFYAPNYIYAPAIMVDRRQSSNGVPPVNPYDLDAMASMVDSAAEIPAPVSISLHAEYDDTAVHVTVRGAKDMEDLCANPRLVCVLTEDDVRSRNQLGYDGTDLYMHQHVSRAVNETFGVPVPFQGDEYEYTVSLPLNNVNDKGNINIVAYIFNYDDANRNNCNVMNAAQLPFSEMGIADVPGIKSDGIQDCRWYTLSGLQLNSRPSASGVYIECRGDKAYKIIVK